MALASRNALPASQVERMYDAYAERQSANHVAKVAGCARSTAKRYIEEGDPARGIEPFALRFARMVRQNIRIKDKRVMYDNARATLALERHIKELDELVALGIQRVRKQIMSQDVKITDIAKCIEIRTRVVNAAKLFTKRTVTTTTTASGVFEGRTAGELRHYAENGTFPVEVEIVGERGGEQTRGGESSGTGPELGAAVSPGPSKPSEDPGAAAARPEQPDPASELVPSAGQAEHLASPPPQDDHAPQDDGELAQVDSLSSFRRTRS